MRRLSCLLVLVCALLAASCGRGEPDLRVLFIGNSYTANNDLPGAVVEIADANGVTIETGAVLVGGESLAGHAKNEEVQGAIRSGTWDVVVIQEQSEKPAILAYVEGETIPNAQTLVRAAVANEARPLIFHSWGHENGSQFTGTSNYTSMQNALDDGFEMISEATGADLVPIGPAWRRAQVSDPSIRLFAADSYHPAPAGTYLSALVMTEMLLGQPLTVAPEGRVDQPTADRLLAVAQGF